MFNTYVPLQLVMLIKEKLFCDQKRDNSFIPKRKEVAWILSSPFRVIVTITIFSLDDAFKNISVLSVNPRKL